MKIENEEVYGIEASIRALRNPMNSHHLGDTYVGTECFLLGEKDKILSQKLTKAGTEHCKHLRLIQVWADFTLPRYIWVEMDTYRFLEKVSCSTMHKLTSKVITQDDFEYALPSSTLIRLNELRVKYNETKDIEWFLRLKNELPEGYLQKRTVNTNYQQLLNIYNQRKNHKLPQWHTICDWILRLPDFKELTGIE
jgi:hypothetical protein